MFPNTHNDYIPGGGHSHMAADLICLSIDFFTEIRKSYTQWPPSLKCQCIFFFDSTPNEPLLPTNIRNPTLNAPCFRSPLKAHIPVTFISECPPPPPAQGSGIMLQIKSPWRLNHYINFKNPCLWPILREQKIMWN